MKRGTTPVLLVGTLLLGMNLGVLLDRGTRPLTAQTSGAPGLFDGRPPAAPRATNDSDLYAQLDRQYAQFEGVNRTFELVARAVSPSVVHIIARKVGKRDGDRREHEFEETGSGVIVRCSGAKGVYVLTNNHVVEGASNDEVQVFLHDGRSIHPDRIWTDRRADVAVLMLGREDLPAARLGDSDRVAVGTWVLAVGSPFGLTHSVSQGIISGRGRHEADLERAGVENQDFLQTDAAINPGNSGGPLVNLKGEVVGLNIAILSNGGGSEGVGFSIPINLARWIMEQLVLKGRVSRGALGIKLQPNFEPEAARDLGLDRPRGALIDSVDNSRPAAKAGLRVGDVVLKYRNIEVVDLNHLINLVSMTPIGQTVDIVIWRARREVSLRVIVGDKDDNGPTVGLGNGRPKEDGLIRRPTRPENAAAAGAVSVLGLELATLDPATARKLGLPETIVGAVVLKVEPDSPVSSYFKPLDVINAVGGKEVLTADTAESALNNRSNVDHLEIGLSRVNEGMIHALKVRLP